jgi:hypothetical protein
VLFQICFKANHLFFNTMSGDKTTELTKGVEFNGREGLQTEKS